MHQTQVSTIIFGLLMKYGEWLDTYTIICNNSDKHTTSPRISNFISNTFSVPCPVIMGNGNGNGKFLTKFHIRFGLK